MDYPEPGGIEREGTLSFTQGSKCNIELREYRYARCSCKIGSKYESLFCSSLFLSPSLPFSSSSSSSSSSSHRFNKVKAESSQAIPACTPSIINMVSLCDSVLCLFQTHLDSCRSFSIRSISKTKKIAAGSFDRQRIDRD